MRALESQFAECWDWSQLAGVTTVVAVSGGADSVALLRLLMSPAVEAKHDQLQRGRAEFVVGHFNHRTRSTSDGDAQFVRKLAAGLGLPCEVGGSQRVSAESGTPSEARWREERYAFLTRLAHARGARYLLTGHTADDQAETVLFNVVRGTGLRGLCGIPESRPLDESLVLRRPLLSFSRSQLVAYLSDLKQPFVTDTTNADVRFTRNRIRHELLPRIDAMLPGDPRDALRRLSQIAGEALEELRPRLDEVVRRAVIRQQAGLTELDCRILSQETTFVVREVMVSVWQTMGLVAGQMSFVKWSELAEIVSSPEDVVTTMPGNVRVAKRGNVLQLAPVRAAD